MTEWNDFYVAVAGASAALTGLLFIGVSISLPKILSIPNLPDRALLSLVLLLTVLVLSMLFLVPGLSAQTLGLFVSFISLLTWFVTTRLDVRNVRSTQHQLKWQYLFNMFIDQLATLCFIITGVAMAAGWAKGEYWIVPGIVLSISKAVLDGWVLLVEINR